MIGTTQTTNSEHNKPWSALTNGLALVLVVAFQILALIALVTIVINAINYFRTPFIGKFIEHTLVFNAADSVNPGSWGTVSNQLAYGHQLLTVDGREISHIQELNKILGSYEVGDVVEIRVANLLSTDRQPFAISTTLQPLQLSDQIARMVIPFIIGLVYLVCGLWVFSLRRYDTTGQVFSTFSASVAVATAGSFDVFTTSQLTGPWTFCLGVAGGTLIHLALIFPEKIGLVRKYPFLVWLGYIPTVILVLWAYPTLFNYDDPLAYMLPRRLEYIYLGIAVIFFIGMGIFRRFTSLSPIVRQQSQVILGGAFFSFTPIAIWFFNLVFQPEIAFSPYLLFPLALFPIAVTYAILRYRILNTDYIFSRAVLYALLTIFAVTGYTLLISGLGLILGSYIPANHPLVIGLMVFVLVLLFNPLRSQLQALIDRVFFRGQQVYRERAEAFSGELSSAMDLPSIISLLRKYVDKTLMPEQQHIYVFDALKDTYQSLPDGEGQPTTDVHFSSKCALPQILARADTFIFIRSEDDLPDSLESDRSRLALLGVQLFIPLPSRDQRVIGFVALGSRKSGEPYTTRDLQFLETLSDQAALAVERAQVVGDLERRVTEMDVLIRVAQGVNITLSFDDILELIYAQTIRLVSARDFWIMLHDPENDLYQYAFYLEDDLRLLEYENRYIFATQDIAQAVIQGGRPIVANDYERECRSRGLRPMVEGLYTWLGVPLNAGAVTIGSMSLASRDPSVVYTNEQISLLQAVADQAAGAIVKSRLLENTERNARQLSLLNEVGKNLTSMLDLPSLLNQILESAMDILNCEAGTLFLIDEETDDLVFEVVAGPVAGELTGRRLPPGTGHVGRAAQGGKPAIVNEVRTTEEWNRDSDQETGFKTQDLLLVPLIVKDRVVGVVEVINRRDKMPFTKDDQDLLTTFTGQAAVALENARLYTLTDQQLAARVDELSVMQRVDRELNASLDVSRSMELTLDWAMRQSGADAGLVGVVEEEGLRIMADQGYADELTPYRNRWLPLDSPGLKEALKEKETQQFSREDLIKSQNGAGLLTDAESQVVIPIRRKDDVIGVLILETILGDAWPDDTQAFLSRLIDHAAIAIANAQLFSQVQAADLAKTEFVSQVSHELKNPMTSIRGYSDLLISGAVGEVSEAQENFLSTIRANVNRMTTIVGDLADISRIESGHLRLDFNAVEISAVVDEVVRAQRREIEEKGQTLEIQIPEDLPAVWGDHTRLVQIIINLVSNANKYTPEGGSITIGTECTGNHWDPDGAPEVVLIAVRDTGLGMTSEDQAKIFTKFFRSEDPKAREAPGTGLGLNITRNLVELQGGKIWFESEYGKGTTFQFTTPVAEV